MTRTRLLLDVDTGIDDAVALLYLAAQQGIEIVAAGSVHGNCTAEQGALNTLRTLELAGLPDVPVAVGAGRPLAQPLSLSIRATSRASTCRSTSNCVASAAVVPGSPTFAATVPAIRPHAPRCTRR